MDFNPIDHIREMMHAEGINFHRMEAPLSELSRFDIKLRHQLYQDYDYENIRQGLLANIHPKTLYIVTDTFEASYIICRASAETEDPEAAFLFIGPYLTSRQDVVLPRVVDRMHIPVTQINHLKNYYNGVPSLIDFESRVLESQLIVLVKYLFETMQFNVSRISLNFGDQPEQSLMKLEPSTYLTMDMIEDRYKNEDYLLDAIGRGDVQTALLHMANFRKFQIEQRNTDSLLNSKNFMHILNTLLRKAVQRADVHPAHIDSLSSSFHFQIEATRNLDEMSRISPEMIRKYCLLVHNHSLRAYSKTIQRVINYVDFHLTDPLSLQLLADVATVNASYLSTQFKKETGQNLTDHINHKRIQKAIFLLNTTELPIHMIAEKVGILDENYFSRLFRKVQGKSPREYRKAIRITVNSEQ